MRIDTSKKALETSRKTVNEVMYEVGYPDLKAFGEMFRKITGRRHWSTREGIIRRRRCEDELFFKLKF